MKDLAVAAFLRICFLSLVNTKSVPPQFYNSGGMGIINANGNIGNNNGNIGGGANSFITYGKWNNFSHNIFGILRNNGSIGKNNGNLAGGASSYIFYGNMGGRTGEESKGFIKFGNVSWDGISFHYTGGIGIINHNGVIGNGIGNIGGGANSRIVIGNLGNNYGTLEGANGSYITYYGNSDWDEKQWEDFQRNLTREILRNNEKWKNFSRDLTRNITRNILRNNQKWKNFSRDLRRNITRNILRNNQKWQDFSINLPRNILKNNEQFQNAGGTGVFRGNGQFYNTGGMGSFNANGNIGNNNGNIGGGDNSYIAYGTEK